MRQRRQGSSRGAIPRNSKIETRNSGQSAVEPPHSKKDPTPTFFWKCVKRKGFKSFVLKVCETKGVTDAFLRKYVNLKGLSNILASFSVSRSFGGLSGSLLSKQGELGSETT